MSQRTFVQSFIFFWIISIAFLFVPIFVSASSIQLSSSQLSIGQNDEYLVNVNLSINVSDGTNYFLRGAFYSPGTTNYCGYTYNGTDWYNGPYGNQASQHLLQITVNNSSWSGVLKAKIDSNDSGCNQSGNYTFKVERFTVSGSGTFDSQNEQTVQLTMPTPTPTPAPTATPTNTPQPTPTPTIIPTATPTQKPTSIIAVRPTIKTGAIPTASSSGLLGSVSAQVLASSTSPTLISAMEEKKETKSNEFVLFFLVGGIFLLVSCGILFYYWKKGIIFHGNNNE